MKTKHLVLGAVGVVAIAAGLNVYTSNRMDSYLKDQVAAIEKQQAQGVTITVANASKSFFNRVDNIDIKFELPIEDEVLVFDFHSQNSCQILPLYVACTPTYEVTSEDPEVQEFLSLLATEYDSGWAFNFWLNSQSGWLNTSEIKAEKEDVTFTFAAMDMVYSGDALGNTINFDLAMSEVSVSSEVEGFDFVMSGLDFTGKSEKTDGVYLLGDMVYGIDSVKMNAEDMKAQLNGFAVEAAVMAQDNDLIGVDYGFSFDDAELVAPGQPGPQTIEKFVTKLKVQNLSQEALVKLNGLTQVESPEQIEEIVNLLGENGITVELEELSAIYNELPADAAGSFDLAAFTMADFDGSMEAMSKLTAELSLHVGPTFTQLFPQFEPMLEQYIDAGLLNADEKEGYTTTLKIEQRMLSANGVTLQQL